MLRRGAARALCARERVSAVRNKAAQQARGRHAFWLNRGSVMEQTDLNANENAGSWDPRKLRCLTGPPRPAPRLSFQLGSFSGRPGKRLGCGGDREGRLSQPQVSRASFLAL